MSEHSQLARTGAAAGVITIGGLTVTGWYLLAIAAAVIVTGAAVIRLAFRPGRGAGQ